VRFDQPGDVATVLRVLYLVFNEGYSGDIDLAAEAIRLTRQLAAVPGRSAGHLTLSTSWSRGLARSDPKPGAPSTRSGGLKIQSIRSRAR
jgi:predicted RNA polymerase sigma factor